MSSEIPSSARPRLANGARLQMDRITGKPVLLFPEGMLQLNATGGAILELCDGRRSIDDVARELAGRFNAAPEAMRGDVGEYIGRLCRRGLMTLDSGANAR